MAYKFFYLYLVAGTVTLLVALWQIYTQYSTAHAWSLLYLVPALLLYYLAYKAYHEKRDHEMM